MSESQDNSFQPEEVADRLLYQTGCGVRFGDFELFASCFELPHIVETFDAKQVIRSKAELQKKFNSVRSHFDKNGVSDVARIILSAQYLDPETIGSTHASRLLRADGSTFRKPFPVYSILSRKSGVWKISISIYAIVTVPSLIRIAFKIIVCFQRHDVPLIFILYR